MMPVFFMVGGRQAHTAEHTLKFSWVQQQIQLCITQVPTYNLKQISMKLWLDVHRSATQHWASQCIQLFMHVVSHTQCKRWSARNPTQGPLVSPRCWCHCHQHGLAISDLSTRQMHMHSIAHQAGSRLTPPHAILIYESASCWSTGCRSIGALTLRAHHITSDVSAFAADWSTSSVIT
jgi:hypothetical protein